ncbi:MAG: threonine synthase [Candidatus Helarchaeota archaeon]
MEVIKISDRIVALECPECGKLYPLGTKYICSECWSALKVKYDYEVIKESFTKQILEKRFFDHWRYFELLPLKDPTRIVSLNDGGTPLLRCDNLASELGLRELYVKNDTINPTLSFKDRPASVGISKCLELGIKTVGCASTGNLAAATAAHAAKARLPCYILVPSTIEISKITQTAVHGAQLVGIEGTYDDANRLGVLACENFGWGLLNINIRPYYTEGSKTLAFETCEQLNWSPPDNIIVPMGSGALLCSTYRALKELNTIGFIDSIRTRISGAQPAGCAPIVKSFHANSEIIPIETPQTIANSLAIGNPASGYEALDIIHNTNGSTNAPTDPEILSAIKLLAKTEGIYTEPAGGVTVAAFINLVQQGIISKDESTVLLITGNGFKAHQTITQILPQIQVIKPTLEDLKNLTTKKEAILFAKS